METIPQTNAVTSRLQLTLPSSEPPEDHGGHTPGDSDVPLTFEYDDTLGETSSISGGELP